MLRATATAEVDSSRRRFPPHFRSDTIPHFGPVVRPLQLGFSDNTCRYDGERLWLSASLTYIRLSQVLPRFLSRAVSPVAHPPLIGLLSVAFDSFATATYRTSHRIGREVVAPDAFLVSRSSPSPGPGSRDRQLAANSARMREQRGRVSGVVVWTNSGNSLAARASETSDRFADSTIAERSISSADPARFESERAGIRLSRVIDQVIAA